MPLLTMSTFHSPPRRQSGIIMVIALITLAIMMVGAVAALRSMNSALSSAGNVGMKRDMGNQAEVALRRAMDALNAATTASLTADSTSMNYSATLLPVTAEGIPTVLVGASPSTLDGKGDAKNVVNLTASSAFGTMTAPQMTMYYVIDRMCQSEGAMTTVSCLTGSSVSQSSNSVIGLGSGANPLYRVTVRVDGPRGAQSFYQATLSK